MAMGNVNKVVKEALEKIAKKEPKKIVSRTEKKLAKENAERIVKNLEKDLDGSTLNLQKSIDENIGLKRKANGRREYKSAKESANIFSRNSDTITKTEQKIDLANEIADARIEAKRNRKKKTPHINTTKEDSLPNFKIDQADYGIKKQRAKRDPIKLTRPTQLNSVDGSVMTGYINSENQFIKLSRGELNDPNPQVVMPKYKNRKGLKVKDGNIDVLRESNKVTSEVGNASAKDPNLKARNFVYKAAAMGVGGGVVLNLFNNKGEQSNTQLYGGGM